ncbi:hypothetical protein [Microbacterium radiodurans]|uniref:SbsA Ig-like domain-containing protein n=1 Tax=Microbacterium radiodurans TaxID=661398 RepID=A0A5J5ITG1_9MICO|nr:hypothetical protein [Microbacterium radiodurans]KAA9089158.1 hypothetical protein F6B42_01260 [Microbacterium radiodurans]
MSTDGRRTRARRRRSRGFVVAMTAVVGVLVLVGAGSAVVTTVQGPRATDVTVDPQAAVESAGSRLIVTTTQSLEEVDPAQVEVEPAADFTVDTSGRQIGIRFALPLRDATDYTVRISGLRGLGGGPTGEVEERFTTPALETFLLQRGGDEDTIFRTTLDGENAEPVFARARIEDFRATATHLAIVTSDDAGESTLTVTDRDGQNARELPLPGPGTVTNLQSADRGDLIGYTFTDADIGSGGTRESELYTASLAEARAADEPDQLQIAGGDSRVDDWRFVPGSDAVLLLTFDGALTLVSTGGGAPVALGNAITIDGIARGSTEAIVQRADGLVAIDLATAEERSLPVTDPAAGETQSIVALPGNADETLRVLSQVDGFTVLSTSVAAVDESGAVRTVFDVPDGALLQHACVSPSSRYAAFLIAPDAVSNPYDAYLLPLPQRLQTHIVDLGTGEEVSALGGFDISWCQSAPRP